MRAVVAVAVTAGLVLAPSAVSAKEAKAKPALAISSKIVTVSESRIARVTLRCGSSKTCKGTVGLRVNGKDSASKAYGVRSKRSKTYSIKLTPTQLAAIPQGGSKASFVRVKEKAPKKIASRSVPIALKRAASPTQAPAPTPTAPPKSVAFIERNWKPTAIDTCTVALHESHSITGADGKLYPTWHGPTDIDPGTGKTCTYGHEHGDDPATSDIYDWVTDFVDEDTAKSQGIPFGSVSEILDVYSSTRDKVMRHEDNVGHKIIVANNVKMIGASPREYVRDDDNSIVTCDFLIKFHQGSHSGDAIINNAHELLYAAKCTDDTELISQTMTRFGNPNEFDRSCDQARVQTSGSNLPDGFGGRRVIPDKFCVDRDALVPGTQQSAIWALYESWESDNRIQTADGTTLARFDPWFGIRNPSRAHAGGILNSIINLVDTLWMVDPADGGTAKGYPWNEVEDHSHHVEKTDPESPFDGAQRDYRLGSTTVDNPTGTSIWWSDPYGDNAVTGEWEGSVRQLVSTTSNTDWPALERSWVNLQMDYGKDNGVHAPN